MFRTVDTSERNSTQHGAVCCGVLVLCCTVLCLVVLCCVVLCCVALCCVLPLDLGVALTREEQTGDGKSHLCLGQLCFCKIFNAPQLGMGLAYVTCLHVEGVTFDVLVLCAKLLVQPGQPGDSLRDMLVVLYAKRDMAPRTSVRGVALMLHVAIRETILIS